MQGMQSITDLSANEGTVKPLGRCIIRTLYFPLADDLGVVVQAKSSWRKSPKTGLQNLESMHIAVPLTATQHGLPHTMHSRRVRARGNRRRGLV
eukprot:SAG11_NODE_1598_length_4610_cov_2.897362_4_plen_94_part_00